MLSNGDLRLGWGVLCGWSVFNVECQHAQVIHSCWLGCGTTPVVLTRLYSCHINSPAVITCCHRQLQWQVTATARRSHVAAALVPAPRVWLYGWCTAECCRQHWNASSEQHAAGGLCFSAGWVSMAETREI
jgi:hypothetical protein